MVHGYRCVVVSVAVVPHCRLLTGSDALCSPAASFLLASTGLFRLGLRSPVVPSWIPRAAPSQVDTVSSHDASCSGRSGCFILARVLLALAFFWQPLVSASGLTWQLCFLHTPALPYAPGSNASVFAAAAFSALLASSMLAIPLARPGMAPATGSAPPSSCALIPADLTVSASDRPTLPANSKCTDEAQRPPLPCVPHPLDFSHT